MLRNHVNVGRDHIKTLAKTCPFGAVIFVSDASKFPSPDQYTGKDVEITGFITAYQGRAEIVLKSPAQIKIAQ